ncbi:MAG: hypothetical protein ACREF5_02905 [Candidatus Saccharimonadales bacterium]
MDINEINPISDNESAREIFPNPPSVSSVSEIDAKTFRKVNDAMYVGDLILEKCEKLNLDGQRVVPSELVRQLGLYISKHVCAEIELPEPMKPKDAIDYTFSVQDKILHQLPEIKSKTDYGQSRPYFMANRIDLSRARSQLYKQT